MYKYVFFFKYNPTTNYHITDVLSNYTKYLPQPPL